MKNFKTLIGTSFVAVQLLCVGCVGYEGVYGMKEEDPRAKQKSLSLTDVALPHKNNPQEVDRERY